MILRRLSEHVRAQNWFAVVLDFLIVVIGVFVGLQVDNWNEARIQRAQEQRLILRLHEDFEQSVAGQTRDIDFLSQQLSDQAVILNSLDACAVAAGDAEAFQRGLSTLGYINPPRLYRRTIDEMANAGETDIIQSEAIKARLAEIVALTEWRAGVSESTARITQHYRYIVEEQVRYDLNRTLPNPFLGETIGVDFDIRALCRNPAISSAVSTISRTSRERQRAFRGLLEQYRSILPMLEGEARRRWHVSISPLTPSSQ